MDGYPATAAEAPAAATSSRRFNSNSLCAMPASNAVMIGVEPDAGWHLGGASPGLKLLVGDVFQPLDGLAVELLGDGDMGQGGGRSGPVPMLLARRKPDDVARPDRLDRTALALSPTAARRHDQ